MGVRYNKAGARKDEMNGEAREGGWRRRGGMMKEKSRGGRW
jgi:hypothetical protein